MTENNIPTCERCGMKLVLTNCPDGRPGCIVAHYKCPLPESACQSIAALRSENEALRKRNEKNKAIITRLEDESTQAGALVCSLRYQLSAAELRAQELETKLRTAEDAVVELSGALRLAVRDSL